MRLVFHNKIPNAFHAQRCPAAEMIQVKFPTLAVQIRICPVALPEKPQKIFSGDRGCRLKDEKALGVAGEFYGNHDTLPDRPQSVRSPVMIHNSASAWNSLMLAIHASRRSQGLRP